MIMDVIDLQSSYLLLKDIADDRRYDTWLGKITSRLESLGVEVTHAISDRARALIKLAVKGFECKSDPIHFMFNMTLASSYPDPFSV